jgi:TfoX/Sxy family transcriptional regulator of competence genes
MQVPKPSEADKATFRALVPEDARVEIKPMFGNLGAFVNGNMFMGLFGADIGVKLAGSDADSLARVEGAGPFGPEERPMSGWLTLPPSVAADSPWIAKALEFVAAMPPKSAKR